MPENATTPLRDGHGRGFAKLRVSLTPACNFRCTYCRPATGVPLPAAGELLSYDEIVRTARVAATLGMRRVRLTGGEPLVRPNVAGLVRRLLQETGVEDVGLTTNGSLLPRHAASLAKAGLAGVNVSLDTLDRAAAARLARADVLASVLAGIDAALDAGLAVKLNAVVMPGVNDSPDDLANLAIYATSRRCELRFIEYMPMGQSGRDNGGTAATVTAAQIRRRLALAGVNLTPLPRAEPSDPSAPWQGEGGLRVGFIHSVSDGFCAACDRMRLTATGGLRPCLHQDAEVDLRRVLRNSGDDVDIAQAFAEAARLKWAGHRMTALTPLMVRREMVTLGG